ncbi:MAG: hypothetical protein ACLGH0_07160 [Thermoanaerobaculia bacterium]
MNPSTWMYDTTAIHNLPLRQICIPTTHDSGTAHLRNPMVGAPGLPEALVKIYNVLPQIAEILANIPHSTIGGCLAAAVMATRAGIFKGVKELATATTSSIGHQLANGIRGLDLRISKHMGEFYTYHGLNGTLLSDVLQDIATFLQQPGGEIVYVTFGHYEGFAAGGRDEQDLLDQIQTVLGAYAYAPVVQNEITNDVWQQTWEQIVTVDGTQSTASRVVLVNGTSALASGIYWPQPYSPPDSTNQNMAIYGAYTNTIDLNAMQSGQLTNYCAALSANLPFALYLTMTPQGSNYTQVIVQDIAQAIDNLGERFQNEHGGIVAIIGRILQKIANVLEIEVPLSTSWTTLAGLTKEIDIDTLIQQFAPAPGQPNPVSMIYLDFYEKTNVVDVAIALSTGQLTNAGAPPCAA